MTIVLVEGYQRCVVSDHDLTEVRQPVTDLVDVGIGRRKERRRRNRSSEVTPTSERPDQKLTKQSEVGKPKTDVYKGNRSPVDLRWMSARVGLSVSN